MPLHTPRGGRGRFPSTARGVSGLDPAPDTGRVAKLRVSNHSIGAANSRATSHNTEFNVLGRSSDVGARCGPHRGSEATRRSGNRDRDPANVSRRAAVSGVGAVPCQSTVPQSAPPGLESSLGRLAMALESRKEPGRREAEPGFNLEDTFAASVEEFDSLIADVQGLAGLGGPGGHRAGGDRDVVAYHSDERDPPTCK